MPRILSALEFTNYVTADFNWRVRELSDFKTSIKRSLPEYRVSLLRACAPIVYAHWEGHVTIVVRAYLDYVRILRMKYSNLKSGFFLNAMSRQFDRIASGNIRAVKS
jgi:hypothetical protein